ncbi:MAG TPA: hypothetical protein ENJ35_02770, partial [Gammaproteobacteria bacterium]|nr:hypothetical protein [Gammaproteobacteria bacterium]
MIQLGGMILAMVGVTVAPYVKKTLNKRRQTRTRSDSSLPLSSKNNLPVESQLHTELAVTENEDRHKLRFILTTGTMGLAVMAQTGFFW